MMAVARRQKAAGGGKRGPPAALLSPPSSEDEAPEEVSFGVAKEAAETERKLVGEAVRRYGHPPPPIPTAATATRAPALPPAALTALPAFPQAPGAAEGEAAAAAGAVHGAEGTVRRGPPPVPSRVCRRSAAPGFTSLYLTRSKGNYTAVCLKDQSITGLHQQLAKDFLNTHLYGPDANRAQANDFFSLENKKNPVKKAAVQFVDKSWGEYKQLCRYYFTHMWFKVHLKKKKLSHVR
ncbi:NOL7 protein, partial [Circaetus pectoralis]|nr:NOL7 protein [Circaetus pectoralis]